MSGPAGRQAAARELLRRTAGGLEVTPDGRVLVRDPALVRELAALKPEIRELVLGIRCLRCGDPLGEQARVPAEGFGFVHRYGCSGYPRRPASTQVARR